MKLFKLSCHINASIRKIGYAIFKRKIKIGKKTTWRRRVYFFTVGKGSISVGRSCFFNNSCSITAMNRVTIGNNCIFGENVKIYDHNHRFRDKDKPIQEQGFSIGEVFVGDNVWVGSNCVILKGAHIGNNCIIGAGCVVSGTISDGTILKRNDAYDIKQY